MVNRLVFARFFFILSLLLSFGSAQVVMAAEPVEQAQMTVNINSASAEEIAAALNGVGQKRAEAIVSYRTKHGAFKTLEQLLEVKGVGSAILEKNRSSIKL